MKIIILIVISLLFFTGAASAINIVATDTIQYANTGVQSTYSGSWQQKYYHPLYEDFTGTMRINFDMRSRDGGYYFVKGVIGRDGGLYGDYFFVGTERTTNLTEYQTYSEDVSITLTTGYLDLRILSVSGAYHYVDVKNFILKYNTVTPLPVKSMSATTGNYWANITWAPGTSTEITNLTKTDSYNVSVNGTWSNGTTITSINTSIPAHGWANITVYAYNSSNPAVGGIGGLSEGMSLNTQIPNNLPGTPTFTSNLTLNEINHTPAVNFTKGTDADGDTVTTYIYLDGSNPPTTLDATTTGSSASIGSNTTLTDGSTYYVRARSWDGIAFSDYSTVDTFRMNSKPSVPTLSLPSNLLTLTNPLVNFTWVAASDSENDSITYDWQVNGTTQGTGVTGLTANKTLPEATHNWSSRAYDGYEYSNWAVLNTFYIVLMPGYIYNTACTHGATWANCTWSDPLLNFDHLVITNKTGTNNSWDSNVTHGVQYKNWTGLIKGQYNYSTQAAGAGGALNNTIIWLNTTVNDYTFNFTGKAISSPSIDQSSGTEIISVNANDSDGNITNMTVTLTYFGVPFTYNMTQGAGDSWSYDFKTSNVGAYYVIAFNATDDYGDTSGSSWTQNFIVTPVVSGGGSPGGGSPSVSTTTPIPSTTTTFPIVSTINLKTMQNDETGQLILNGGLGIGALMMIWGAIGKRTTTGTLIWGLIIMVVSAYGLGLIS